MLTLLVALSILVAPDSTTVPLKLLYGSRAAVEVTIDGKGPYLFVIETGAPMVLVTQKVADELGLPTAADGPMIHSPNGPVSMRQIDSLRIGTMVLRDLRVAPAQQFIEGVDGLLGLPAYKDLLLTIDYPGNVVRFEHGALPQPNGIDVFPTVPIGPFFGVELTIAGKKYPAVLDTQSGTAVSLPPYIGDSLPWAQPLALSGIAIVGGRAPVQVRSGRLAGDITLGAYTLQRPVIGVNDVPPGFPNKVNLGGPFLRNFAFTLDQQNGRVRFVRAGKTIPPAPPFYATGMRTAPAAGGPLTAEIINEAGAAYAAGMRTGDSITSVNGHPAAEYSWPETLGLLVQTGRPIHMTVTRSGKTMEFVVTPTMVVK